MKKSTEVTLEEAINVLSSRVGNLTYSMTKNDVGAQDSSLFFADLLDQAQMVDDICFTIRRIIEDMIVEVEGGELAAEADNDTE